MRIRNSSIIPLLIIIIVFLQSQGTAWGNDETSEMLTVGMVETAGNFQPFYYPRNSDKYVIDLVFQRLLRRDLNGDWVGEAAESWSVSDDLKEIRFTLREDLTFSDGEPLTADDLVFTYSVLMDPSFLGGHVSYTEELVTVEALNPAEVLFVFEEGSPDNLSRANFYITPEHYYGQYYASGDTSELTQVREEPLGSGPYFLSNYFMEQFIFLERNPSYYDENVFSINEILFENVTSNTLMPSLLQGEIDLISRMTEVRHLKRAQEEEAIQYNRFFSDSYSVLKFNHENGPTRHVEVRKALQLAMDFQGLVDHYFNDFAKVPRHPFGENSFVIDQEFENRLRAPDYNIEEAAAVLEDAGWCLNSEGMREKNGEILELHIVAANYSDIVDTLTPLWDRDWANALGISLIYSHGPIDRVLNQVLFDEEESRSGWNVVYLPQSVNPHSPLSVAERFHSSTIGTGHGNISRYANTEVDELIERAQVIHENEILIPIYQEIATLLQKDWMMAPVYTQEYADLYTMRLDYFETNNFYRWPDALRHAKLLDIDIDPIPYEDESERSWFITIGVLIILYGLFRWNRRNEWF